MVSNVTPLATHTLLDFLSTAWTSKLHHTHEQRAEAHLATSARFGTAGIGLYIQ